MTLIQTFHGTASNGTPLTAVYAEQPAAAAAFALVFPGSDLPRFVHWGRPLTAPETVINTFDALAPQRVSGALDYTAWPSVLPTQSEAWSGSDRFDVRRDGVELFCKFQVTDIKAETVAAGKTYTMAEKDGYPSWSVASEPKQTPTVTVTAEDVEQCVKLTWTCELDETGLIRQHAEVTNTGEGRLEIGKIELAFSVPADANEILTTTGHHLRERSPQRQDFTIGRFAKSSMIGRPDFDATLLLSVGEHGFGFTHGNVYSAHVAWSGNSVLSAERLPYTTGVIGGGEVLFGGEVGLEHGESYTTPWLVGSYGEGLNEVASRFHGYIRRVHRDWLVDHGIAPKPRPVILNTWEAVYFNHDYDTLTALADKAVESGVERFVVDDGWFGVRNDDKSGLGDWFVNEKKLCGTLSELVKEVHDMGLSFGLWFEPEMISEDSDLYREHPDWALTIPGRNPVRSRNQLVLDFSRKEVVDGIFGQISAVLDNANIEYVKWDMNRSLMDVFSVMTKEQGRVMYDYVLGLYDFLDRMVNRYPDLLIEGCSGGGGRFDAGMLYYTPQIWCSDNSDAIDRLRIQYGTSFGYPVSAMGAHVSAVPNHQTGRITPLHTRGVVAMSGTFGYELDLLKLTEEEKDEVRSQIGEFRKYAPLIQNGRYYRLTDPFKSEVCAWEIVGNSQEEVLLNVVMEEIHGNMTVNYVQLRGLDESALYKEQTTGRIYSGAALMHGGMPLPAEFGEYRAYQYHFVRE